MRWVECSLFSQGQHQFSDFAPSPSHLFNQRQSRRRDALTSFFSKGNRSTTRIMPPKNIKLKSPKRRLRYRRSPDPKNRPYVKLPRPLRITSTRVTMHHVFSVTTVISRHSIPPSPSRQAPKPSRKPSSSKSVRPPDLLPHPLAPPSSACQLLRSVHAQSLLHCWYHMLIDE